MGNLEASNGRVNARRSDRSPNTVAQDISHALPYLPFLQHFPRLLCYDGTHVHTGPALGRKERGWTLLPWWIRRSRCYASGGA
jgi:hypothetical protein